MATTAMQRKGMPRAVVIGLIVGWVVILGKCLAAPSIIAHWQIPIHPGWVIVPSLLFAALITLLAVTHDWVRDEEEEE